LTDFDYPGQKCGKGNYFLVVSPALNSRPFNAAPKGLGLKDGVAEALTIEKISPFVLRLLTSSQDASIAIAPTSRA